MNLLFLVGRRGFDKPTADLSPYDIVSTATVYNYFLRREIERISDWKTATYHIQNVKEEPDALRFLSGYTPPEADHVVNLEQRGFSVTHPLIFDFFARRTQGAVCAICDHDQTVGPEDYLFHVQPSMQGDSRKSVHVTWAASPEFCYPAKEAGTLNLLIDHRNYVDYRDRTGDVLEQVSHFAENVFPKIKSRLGYSRAVVRQFVSGGIAEVDTANPKLEERYDRRGLPFPEASRVYRDTNVFFVTKAESMGLSVLECAMAGALVVVPQGFVAPHLLQPLNHIVWNDRIDWDEVIAKLNVELSAACAARFNWQNLAALFLNKLRLHGTEQAPARAPVHLTSHSETVEDAAGESIKTDKASASGQETPAGAANSSTVIERQESMTGTVQPAAPRYAFAPFTDIELMRVFNTDLSSAKHLLTIYSISVGLKSQVIIDLGIGNTTRALRAAAEKTGGCVYSCDRDASRFEYLLAEQTSQWKLFLGGSDAFFEQLENDILFDFVMHDAAHDYKQVRRDLERILPRMKQFGVICIHDTQQYQLGPQMLAAVRDAVEPYKVSFTTLPYGAGMTIVRIEESQHAPVQVAGRLLHEDRLDTAPITQLAS